MDIINTTILKNLLKLPKDADKYFEENPVKVLSSAMIIKSRSAYVHRAELASKPFQFDFKGNFTRFQ